MELRVRKLDEKAILPTKAYATDLGFDLYALHDVELPVGNVTKVSTGIAVDFPRGERSFGGLIRDRSSMATNRRMFVVAGVIDPTYTGEIIVAMYVPNEPPDVDSFGNYAVWYREIQAGDKIAQLIIVESLPLDVVEVDVLTTTDRNANGFGSSGT